MLAIIFLLLAVVGALKLAPTIWKLSKSKTGTMIVFWWMQRTERTLCRHCVFIEISSLRYKRMVVLLRWPTTQPGCHLWKNTPISTPASNGLQSCDKNTCMSTKPVVVIVFLLRPLRPTRIVVLLRWPTTQPGYHLWKSTPISTPASNGLQLCDKNTDFSKAEKTCMSRFWHMALMEILASKNEYY